MRSSEEGNLVQLKREFRIVKKANERKGGRNEEIIKHEMRDSEVSSEG